MSLIDVKDLVKHFPVEEGFTLFKKPKKNVLAVDGISFTIEEKETFALIGESGCGKTTTGRLLLRLIEPTSGAIYFKGHDILRMKGEEMRKFRSRMGIVFQDPYSSLNPRKTIGLILAKPFEVHSDLSKDEIRSKVLELLSITGLDPPESYVNRYPHEFSGGQRQRIAFARAISLTPQFVVADEPVSALDVSIRGQILKLMKSIQDRLGVSYLFITHDLAVARNLSKRVAIMYLGQIVERADVEEAFNNPKHPYTKALLSASLAPDPKVQRKKELFVIKGEVPSPIDPPKGCRFHTRCPLMFSRCKEEEPTFINVGKDHFVACHLAE